MKLYEQIQGMEPEEALEFLKNQEQAVLAYNYEQELDGWAYCTKDLKLFVLKDSGDVACFIEFSDFDEDGDREQLQTIRLPITLRFIDGDVIARINHFVLPTVDDDHLYMGGEVSIRFNNVIKGYNCKLKCLKNEYDLIEKPDIQELKDLRQIVKHQEKVLAHLKEQQKIVVEELINNVYKKPEDLDKSYVQFLRDKTWALSNKYQNESDFELSDHYAEVASKYQELMPL